MPSAGPEAVEESAAVLSEGLRLEARLSYPADAPSVARAALILPPHPFLGGDMDGNVTRELAPALVARGFMTLVFNYRGIGRSETAEELAGAQKEFWENSTCPAYEEKIFVDSFAALETLASAAPGAALSVAGYSFGSLPALDLSLRFPSRVRRTVLISPPLAKWALKDGYFSAPQPKAVFFSPGDFACPEDRLLAAFEKFSGPKSLFRFDGCGHFYLGREKELAAAAASFLAA